MNKLPVFTALRDGTHIHYKYDGTETYCTQKHPRKLPEWAKNLIIIETAVIFLLLVNLILLSNNR